MPGAGERCGICGVATLALEPSQAPVPDHYIEVDEEDCVANAELTFAALRQANTMRLPLFKNARGEPAHSQPDGSDWCLAQWCNAVTGELGEAANLIKKIERGDLTLDQAREDLGRELADVQTYLDILAFRAGIDLGMATISKWNEVSRRINVPIRLLGLDPPTVRVVFLRRSAA